MPIDSVIHTNRHSIDRVLKAGLPVVLVFWDRNRAPIKTGDAELDKLASRYAGKALIAKVDADDESELLNRFEASGVPSFVFLDDGKAVERTQVDDPAYVDAWLRHLTGAGPKPAPAHQRNSSGSASNRVNGRGAPGASENAHAESGGGKPVTLTDSSFQRVISGSAPVLVDFWAEWCGPCHMVAPSIEALAQEFDGRAVVGKLNVEENQMTASQYGVRSIPTLLIFKNGQVVDQLVGAQPLPVLRQRLASHV
jgi:thioredoxin 1